MEKQANYIRRIEIDGLWGGLILPGICVRT